MTDLTLEELADGRERESRRADNFAFDDWCVRNGSALLAMARELVRIRQALEFLAGDDDLFDLWKEDDGFHAETPHGLHGVTAADATQALLHHCRRRGWPDPLPPSERKGEG